MKTSQATQPYRFDRFRTSLLLKDMSFSADSVQPGEVLADPQFAARGFFVDIEHPATGTVKYPGPPFLMSGTPWGPAKPAPLLGQDNQEVFGQHLGYTNDEMSRLRSIGVI